jgi:ubiquinone/menaquinone biosynthesis C-methylase UbiE
VEVLRCCCCGFQYVDTESVRYPANAQYVYDEPEIGCINPDQPHLYRRVRDILRFAHPPGRALDIGCGKGEVPLLLARRGFSCTGIDMKPRLIQHLQENFPTVTWRRAMTNELEAEETRFDVLTMYHVLEHIPNPVEALRNILRLARPGSLVVVEVPNVGGWEARFKGPKWHYCKVDHVNYFRPVDLKRLAGLCGLNVLGIRAYQHFSYPQDVWWKNAIKGAAARIGFQDVVSVFLQLPR